MLLLSSQAALAQFKQDGQKLVGMLATGAAEQGSSVALSADGGAAIVGGPGDNNHAGAAWVYTRGDNGVWTRQGGKLLGKGAVGEAQQGFSVALSADGATAIVGAPYDDKTAGAAWVFTRKYDVWSQQGAKLVGTGAVGHAQQGFAVALSADGDTAYMGGPADNAGAGAAWVFTRKYDVWSQQGAKLVGTGAAGEAQQGIAVSASANGDTLIVGGNADNHDAGAFWTFIRAGGAWKQQGDKLVGSGAVGKAQQGFAVALSGDGVTAAVGGPADHSDSGAAWLFTHSQGVWSQQGAKLVGMGAVGTSVKQGWSVGLSANGDTAIVGGYGDNTLTGATWPFMRSGGVWSEKGGKRVGTGAVGQGWQGYGVGLSGDGDTAIVGGPGDNSFAGAAWLFLQPLQVSPYAGIAASGTKGGPFSPSSFSYKLRATSGGVKYSISGVPSWLTASSKSGTLTTADTTITFTLNSGADTLASGAYVGSIQFNNADGTQGSIWRGATLTVKPE